MDRFIEYAWNLAMNLNPIFKIQYGQIYRLLARLVMLFQILFKIQYGQIYRNDRARIQDNCDDLKSNMDRFIVYCFSGKSYP